MEQVNIDEKDEIIMNLVHYFVTEQNYNPVVVHGINDEIWLENMNSDYKIVRIVSKYIHNDEQLGFDRYRSKQVTKKLQLKTFSFKMKVLSLYMNLGDNVSKLDEESNGTSLFVKNISDIKNEAVLKVFPDIVEKTTHKETGMELLFKVTDDINHTNEKKNKLMEKIFSAKKPIITYAIIAICVCMFVLTNFGYDNKLLIKYGANVRDLVRNGEYWRLIAYMFLHGGILHIVLNMYSLFYIGPRVEDFFGKWKFLVIYLLSGICGGLLSMSFNGNVIAIGASGAIFGLFGALLYFGYNYRGYIGAMIKSQIVPIVAYNLIMGFFIPGIDIYGHIGGLIGGVLAANMVGTIENKKINFMNVLLFLVYFGFLVYLALFYK